MTVSTGQVLQTRRYSDRTDASATTDGSERAHGFDERIHERESPDPKSDVPNSWFRGATVARETTSEAISTTRTASGRSVRFDV